MAMAAAEMEQRLAVAAVERAKADAEKAVAETARIVAQNDQLRLQLELARLTQGAEALRDITNSCGC
jgi:hypothetical protein